jgi:acyl-CoA thioester hydrolase
MSEVKSEWPLARFPSQTFDKLRRCDTGQHGHVNNVIFPAFCETGRAEIVRHPEFIALTPGFVMFIARFVIDYRAELFWPGTVEIGTGVKTIGRSSFTFSQGLYQNGKCVAIAETVLVQVDGNSSRPAPLAAATKLWLSGFLASESRAAEE